MYYQASHNKVQILYMYLHTYDHLPTKRIMNLVYYEKVYYEKHNCVS